MLRCSRAISYATLTPEPIKPMMTRTGLRRDHSTKEPAKERQVGAQEPAPAVAL